MNKSVKKLLGPPVRAGRYAILATRDWRAGRQLRSVQDNTAGIADGDVLLVVCLRNEKFRMPAFVDHYRRLGVDHFLVIDNGSTDGLQDWAAEARDISVWYTEASYKKARFGMLWCNDLLRRYGTGHWCVTVDPDELLVYPFYETRGLKALCRFLEDDGREIMHSVMLDAYSDRDVDDTVLSEGDDPFRVCPYFDGDGYVQETGWGNGTCIRGGPRQRVHFRRQPETAPALNKAPLVRWRRHYHYRMSMHDAYPLRLNRAHARSEVSLTGALFHFKLIASLEDKAREEMQRREHFAGSREYEQYLSASTNEFYEEGLSTRYEGSAQLQRLGLMSAGKWF
jgi:hypothetical protein